MSGPYGEFGADGAFGKVRTIENCACALAADAASEAQAVKRTTSAGRRVRMMTRDSLNATSEA
jgi:hypothetical protein